MPATKPVTALTLHNGQVLPDTLFGVTPFFKIIPMYVIDVRQVGPTADDPHVMSVAETDALNPGDNDEHAQYWKKLHINDLENLGGLVFTTLDAAKARATRLLRGQIEQEERSLSSLRSRIEQEERNLSALRKKLIALEAVKS